MSIAAKCTCGKYIYWCSGGCPKRNPPLNETSMSNNQLPAEVQAAKWNPNDKEREATTYAAIVISFLSDLVHKLSTGSTYEYIDIDYESAWYHFCKLSEILEKNKAQHGAVWVTATIWPQDHNIVHWRRALDKRPLLVIGRNYQDNIVAQFGKVYTPDELEWLDESGATDLQKELEHLRQWKKEAAELLGQIYSYAHKSMEIGLGESIISAVIDRCKKADKMISIIDELKVIYPDDIIVLSIADKLNAAWKGEKEDIDKPDGENDNVIFDSKWMIGRSEERFKELEHKGWEWRSFYNGWIEGRSDAVVDVLKRKNEVFNFIEWAVSIAYFDDEYKLWNFFEEGKVIDGKFRFTTKEFFELYKKEVNNE